MKKTVTIIIGLVLLVGMLALFSKNKTPAETKKEIEELVQEPSQTKTEETEDIIIKEETKKIPEVLNFEVSFEIVHVGEHITFCYTNDPDSLWGYIPWAKEIKLKMESLKTNHVYLFDSEQNTPDLNSYEFNIPSEFEQLMVCRYLTFANGNTEFCFGGKKEDGRWVDCRVKKPQ